MFQAECKYRGTISLTGQIGVPNFSNLAKFTAEENYTGYTKKKWFVETKEIGNEFPARMLSKFELATDCFAYIDSQNGNYLTIELAVPRFDVYDFHLSCTLSLKDIQEDLKFTQSAAFSRDDLVYETENFIEQYPRVLQDNFNPYKKAEQYPPRLERYIKGNHFALRFEKFIRFQVLLNSIADYTPEDTLRLNCEIIIDFWSLYGAYDSKEERYKWAMNKNYITDKEYLDRKAQLNTPIRAPKLSFSSAIYPQLCEESMFFKRIAETDMLETRSGGMDILYDEVEAFVNLLFFIESNETEHLTTPFHIFQLYMLSQKYLLFRVKEVCQELIIRHFTKNSAAMALLLALRYDDQQLESRTWDYINTLPENERKGVEKILRKHKKGSLIGILHRYLHRYSLAVQKSKDTLEFYQ